MDIFLIRHTTPRVNPGICYGQTDLDVADSFHQEAASVRDRLSACGSNPMAYSSPLIRCRKLANYCGFDAPVLDARLMEKNFGTWEMKPWDAIRGPEAERWYKNWTEVAPPGGESLMQQYERMAAFLDELKVQHTNQRPIFIFTHGGIQTLAGVYAGLYPMVECFDNTLPYGSILPLSL